MDPQAATAGEVTPAIREFCRQLDPTREPLRVPVRPAPGASGSRFAFLKEHVAGHGGKLQHGWIVSEYPGWYLEAVFHGVWVAPGGELVDLAPRAAGAGSILFLPDSRRTYRGEGILDRFMALSNSPEVQAVVRDAEMHAKIRAEAATQSRRERVQGVAVGRNDPCPCGSGLKYKRCCGQAR